MSNSDFSARIEKRDRVGNPVRHKSPVLAGLLALLLPGLGQIYCGQDNKGVFLAALALLGFWLTNGDSAIFLGPLMCADAVMLAMQLNKGASSQRWRFFPALKMTATTPEWVIPLALSALVALLAIVHLLAYVSDYHPEK